MKTTTSKTKKRNTVRVNFEGVETRAKIPDGQYHVKVDETSVEEGDKAPYIKWVFEIVEDGKFQGRKLFYNTSLAPQALWNLRNLLETLGVETPDKETELDLDSYSDLELMVRVENEVWDGKERPKVTDFSPIEETATAGGKEEEEEGSGEDDEAEEETEDEAEEEAEDGKLTAAEVREMDDAELADLVKTNKLKLDLSKIGKRSKKIAAVIDAMEAKDLLAEE